MLDAIALKKQAVSSISSAPRLSAQAEEVEVLAAWTAFFFGGSGAQRGISRLR